jgi:DNA-binding MarR family transcriptional regulator
MADPISRPFSESDIRRGIELIYFGYSHLTRAADERLAAQGLGRAHHRVLYFVSRQPGLNVSELLRLLNVTKQSLSRVLGELTQRGLVELRTSAQDRRQRLLFLTGEGAALETALFCDLSSRLSAAYGEAGTEAVPGYWAVLTALITMEDRAMVRALGDA